MDSIYFHGGNTRTKRRRTSRRNRQGNTSNIFLQTLLNSTLLQALSLLQEEEGLVEISALY